MRFFFENEVSVYKQCRCIFYDILKMINSYSDIPRDTILIFRDAE
jgi:hypothetical protein